MNITMGLQQSVSGTQGYKQKSKMSNQINFGQIAVGASIDSPHPCNYSFFRQTNPEDYKIIHDNPNWILDSRQYINTCGTNHFCSYQISSVKSGDVISQKQFNLDNSAFFRNISKDSTDVFKKVADKMKEFDRKSLLIDELNATNRECNSIINVKIRGLVSSIKSDRYKNMKNEMLNSVIDVDDYNLRNLEKKYLIKKFLEIKSKKSNKVYQEADVVSDIDSFLKISKRNIEELNGYSIEDSLSYAKKVFEIGQSRNKSVAKKVESGVKTMKLQSLFDCLVLFFKLAR